MSKYIAPHDSVAKNKREYNSCVARYFRDELGGAAGIDDNDDDNNDDTATKKRACTGMMGQSHPERCRVVPRRNKDKTRRVKGTYTIGGGRGLEEEEGLKRATTRGDSLVSACDISAAILQDQVLARMYS